MQLGQMMIDSGFVWQGTGLWYDNRVDSTKSDYATTVLAWRQDAQEPLDPADSTYVITSVGGQRYIFMVNGRTREPAQRHITVKLANLADEWKVTNVLTGDVWIVKPSDTPDATTTANGFTDYFEPGSAGLYRLEPITNQTFAWSGCFDASVYVEPAATLLLDNTHVYNFNQNHGLYVEGTLSAYQTTFGPCDTELGWKGIVARNSGQVSLDECLITGAVSGVTCGSGATATLTGHTQITSAETALTLLDGTINSTSTIGSNINGYYLWCVGSGVANIKQDQVLGQNTLGSSALCLFGNGTCNVE